MRLKEFNKEVFYVGEDIAKISIADIDVLKHKALGNDRQRVRLCFHKDMNDIIHEMLIIHTKDTYVRPHKHLHKSESLHVVEGSADVIIFDERGNIVQVIPVGECSSGRKFYYRMAGADYHTLIIHSDFLVFYETTKGPFSRLDTLFAPWSPEENDRKGCREYRQKLTEQILLNFSSENV